MGAGRDLDIVIYGATGSVGGLTARYLATSTSGLRIALAGRSAQRLAGVRHGVGANARDWPLFECSLSDQKALRAIAIRARVVISAIGPYGPNGLPVVEACAATGTDYVDLAGEVPFVRKSIDLHNATAIGTGARIVHSCGFESVPSDLAVYALHRRVVDDGAGELGDTVYVLRSADYASGFSRATVGTMFELMRAGSDDRETRRLLDDPYALSPNRAAEPTADDTDLPLYRGEEIDPSLAGLWTSANVLGRYNTRSVRRSNALLNWRYGSRFRYTETASMGNTVAAPTFAAMTNATIAGAARLGGPYLRLFPPGLLELLSTRRTAGHDTTWPGHYRVETYTTSTAGTRYRAVVTQQGDPGYAATSVLLAESAMVLVRDRHKLTALTGVLTPVSAMGDVLLDRLPPAGVKIDIERLS